MFYYIRFLKKLQCPQTLASVQILPYNICMDKTITYIVTGCTGYVGNVLTKKLLDEGCRVVGLARSREKAQRIFGEHAPTLVYGDISDCNALDALFAGDGPFVVIHTIAKVTIGEGSRRELYNVTVEGTREVTARCITHHARLLHISSTEALGGIFDEDVTYEYARKTTLDDMKLCGVEVKDVIIEQEWYYCPHVYAEEYANGRYDKVEAKQGQRGTYYAGEVMSLGDMEETVEYSKDLVDRFF